MADFKIRFNTEHNGSPLKWRVVIDGEEQLAKNIIVNCGCKTSEDLIIVKDMPCIKHHITCESTNFTWNDDKVLTIN